MNVIMYVSKIQTAQVRAGEAAPFWLLGPANPSRPVSRTNALTIFILNRVNLKFTDFMTRFILVNYAYIGNMDRI